MKATIVSGSRADHAPLVPVAVALGTSITNIWPRPSPIPSEWVKSCASVLGHAAAHLQAQNPDFVVLLGDRYEVLSVALAANMLSIPIVHLSGGDITTGSQDNSTRHAITKLANIHFPTCEESADRIRQMGEETWRIRTVGCPGVDHLLSLEPFDKNDTMKALGVTTDFILVTYQSPTLSPDAQQETEELLTALRRMHLPCIFATVNPDNGAHDIEMAFKRFCLEGRGHMAEMSSRLYISAMKHCTLMIGNSSSGFYEAPTLKRAFVNVGDRQRGRLAAASVVHTEAKADAIMRAVLKARTMDCSQVTNLYGDGHAAERIKAALTDYASFGKHQLLMKEWSNV